MDNPAEKNAPSIRQAVAKKPVNVWCIFLSMSLYLINKFYLSEIATGWIGFFCRCFLNDFMCPLFFLSFSQILLIWAEHEITSYWGIIFLGMSGGILWEYVAPLINPRAVSDPLDLVCYFVGANIYFCISKQAPLFWLPCVKGAVERMRD